jgi:pilus assembly protein Flp/PilA
MNGAFWRLRRFLADEDGPAAIEYAVMASLIVVVCLAVIRSIGASTLGSLGAFGAAMSATGGS